MNVPEKTLLIEIGKKVGRDLIKTYGKKKFYRSKEIKTSMEKLNLSEWNYWAMCFFTDHTSFDNYYASNGKTYDYIQMKSQVVSALTLGESDAWKNFDYNSSWIELPGIDFAAFFELPDFKAFLDN